MFILIFMCQIKLINFVMFLLHVKYLILVILSQPADRDLVMAVFHLDSEPGKRRLRHVLCGSLSRLVVENVGQ